MQPLAPFAKVATLGAALAALLLVAFEPASAQLPPRASYAFTNVNVVPMDTRRVLEDQTVIVQAGRIAAIGAAATINVPANTTRIDGRGKYLMPGLAEMHGHLPTSASEAEDFLFLYLAGGATTVRGMQGHASQLELKRRVDAGELLGPRMWLAAPSLNGNSAPDAATGERLVRQAKADGYDLLKIHEGLSADTYAAIVRTARELSLPFGGHVPAEVAVSGALAARQTTIDHLDDYIDAMQAAGSPALTATGADRQRLLPIHADVARIPVLARATREANVAVVPTQMLWEVLRGARDPAALAARPDNRYMPAETRAAWLNAATNAYNNANRESAAREARLRQLLLKAMSDAGVTILMGTDAPQIFSVPGFSLHYELPLMVESGMAPYRVLRTGTVNVARHLGIEDVAGTVAVGKNADLLLLDANPLDNIDAVKRSAGIMIDGRWLARDAIEARLEAIATKFAN